MNFSEENIPQFDAYIRGGLSETDKLAFEHKLNHDANFNAEFAAFNQFEKAIENSEILNFKTNLKNWDTPQSDTKPKGKIINLRLMIAVAAVAILGFFVVNYAFKKPSNEQLVATYFMPYDNVLTVRGVKEDLDDALLLYEQKKYTESIPLLNRYPENEMAIFYAAESYSALANYPEAVTRYEILLGRNTIFSDISTFHLALAYLGQNNTEKAIGVFETIPANSDYFDEAELLLEDLK